MEKKDEKKDICIDDMFWDLRNVVANLCPDGKF